MIIPYGHEQTSVRRLPWVTFTLMGLCVLLFVGTNLTGGAEDAQVEAYDRLYEVFEYLAEHPYLELSPRLDELLRDKLADEEYDLMVSQLAAMKEFTQEAAPSERQIRSEQKRLDELVEQVLDSLGKVRDSPLFRWGLVPAQMRVETLLSYQFLHGGWMHLIGNLLFLFLAGPFIEDVWGRPLFGGFYLFAGVISGLMYAVHYPDMDGPLIGASGAVAGLMGAFLVRYWNTKIKFFYWFFIFFRGTFLAPAWLMLPLWFARELFFAQAWDVISPSAGGGGIAHWAHVWGFVFGLAVAGGLKYYRVEERYIHQAIESKITLVDNTAVEQALEASSQGRVDEGFARLRKELKEHPTNLDAAMALWNLSLPRGEAASAAPHMVRMIRHSLRTDEPSLVLNHWHELLDAAPDITVDAPLAAGVGEVLHEHGRSEDLATTLDLATRHLTPETAPGVLSRLARLAGAVHSRSAMVFIEAALAHPDTSPQVRGELESLAEVQLPSIPAADESAPGPDMGDATEASIPEPLPHTLQVMEVVPIAMADGALTIEADGRDRRMALDQVQAVGVAGIQRGQQRPYLVVDLLLDPPWSERTRLRVLRLTSTAFDPRKIVGGPDALQAFRHLLDKVLNLSEAVPLPDPDAARGNPFRTFSSIEEYQREVLGVEHA
jgi:membrane associated rhomboid family serine protease